MPAGPPPAITTRLDQRRQVFAADLGIDRATHRMADARAQEAALQIADAGTDFAGLAIA
jgi:hypothetical protein